MKVYHVKSARKDNQVAKKGESYYWWKFRYGGKRYSKTYPKRSQLTQSPFYQDLYNLEDSISDELTEDDAREIIYQLEELRDTCQDNLDNMPEHLQDTSESGILLQERIDYLDDWINEIDSLDFDEMTPEEISESIRNASPF